MDCHGERASFVLYLDRGLLYHIGEIDPCVTFASKSQFKSLFIFISLHMLNYPVIFHFQLLPFSSVLFKYFLDSLSDVN